MKIAVAGGTGTVGRRIVATARERGHDVRVLARSSGVDVLEGTGLDAALQGVDVVIDAVNVQTLDAGASTAFFERSAGALLAAAARGGVGHAVALSIVGIDRSPHGYYAGKLAQEAVYERAAVPWSIVRATQFHEFAGQIAAQARLGPVQLAPAARLQPIAASAVAAHIVETATSAPAGRGRDIAGPREESLSEMIRAWTRHAGDRRVVVPVRLPGAQLRAMRRGLVLPTPDALRLGPTFAAWLDGGAGQRPVPA